MLNQIVAKVTVRTVNGLVVGATNTIQICSGVLSGVQAAVYSIRKLYEYLKTEGILLVDAKNAFNFIKHLTNVINNVVNYSYNYVMTYIVNTFC